MKRSLDDIKNYNPETDPKLAKKKWKKKVEEPKVSVLSQEDQDALARKNIDIDNETKFKKLFSLDGEEV